MNDQDDVSFEYRSFQPQNQNLGPSMTDPSTYGSPQQRYQQNNQQYSQMRYQEDQQKQQSQNDRPPEFDPNFDDEGGSDLGYSQRLGESQKNNRKKQRGKIKNNETCKTGNCGNGGYCIPLYVYLFFSLFILFFIYFSVQSVQFNFAHILFQVLWILLFASLIYYFCKRNNMFWAWTIMIIMLLLQSVLVGSTGIWVVG